MPVITRKVAPDSVVYTDSYRSYNVLMLIVFIMSELTILKILQKVEIILMV
ncbi:putative d-alanyl-D-alanine carboxypeptidase/endopeptidase [Acinetobacter baumannii 6935]|nr:putative d-alanyl-D-alanine carboxypeptidase/endopeptidase [Acinetobacter baumannii 6935]